ncbi:MAG: DUF4743 domain-containing protein [Dongiaceae bacterium]
MSLLDRVKACMGCDRARYRPFLIGAARVGWIDHDLADRLRGYPDVFLVAADRVELARHLDSFAARSAAVDDVLSRLWRPAERQHWRHEFYPVATSFHAPPLMQIERAAVPAFGIRGHGVHLNGFVGRGPDMKMWIARRSRSRPVAPGKLDHLVAGGQPIGLGLMENLVKECAEEAAMPAALARRARPAGAISYLTENEDGLRDDVVFTYDLELPADFTPRNTDGEIEEFLLWPLTRVIELLADTDEFKFNVALVIIDFLARHGFLGPDDPDYFEIVHGLRRQPEAGPTA